MNKSKIIDLLNGYDSEEKSEGNGRKFYVKVVSGSVSRAKTSRISETFNSFTKKAGRVIAFTTARTYGIFLLTFGLLSLLIHFIKDYLKIGTQISLLVLVLSSVISITAIPFLLSDKPLPTVLQEFPLTDYIFFEFFCIKRMHKRDGEKGVSPWIAFISGIFFALLSTVVPLPWIVVGLFGTVYLFVSFISSEFSYFFLFLILPYIPLFPDSSIVFSVFVGIICLSVLRKVIVGKRVYFFEKYDLIIFVLMFLVSLFGLLKNGVSSLSSSLIIFVLTLGYSITGSVVTNRRLADATVNAIVISSIPVSIFAIYEFIISLVNDGIKNLKPSNSTFDNPTVLAVFLMIVTVFSVYFAKVRHNTVKKVLYSLTAFLSFLALSTTLSVFAYVALLFCVAAYSVTKMRHISGISLVVLCLLPNSLIFMNPEIAEKISKIPVIETLNLPEFIERWRTSFKVFLDNIWTGVGIDEKKFGYAYSKITSEKIFQDSGNFILQIACEIGIISLVVFVLLFLTRLRHREVYFSYVKYSSVIELSRFTSAVIVCLFAFGTFNYIFQDVTLYYLFFCLLGIGSSTLRISKQEYDAKIGYFKDGAAADSSSIDIEVNE